MKHKKEKSDHDESPVHKKKSSADPKIITWSVSGDSPHVESEKQTIVQIVKELLKQNENKISHMLKEAEKRQSKCNIQ